MAKRKPKQLRPDAGLYRGKPPKRRDTLNARAHATQRAAERFGAEFTKSDMAQLVRLVQQGAGKLLETQPPHRELWLITYRNQPIPVVYDRRGSTIVSVLPAHHKNVVAHIGLNDPAGHTKRNPRLGGLGDLARELGLQKGSTTVPQVIREGELARHVTTGVEGSVLEACMETRTITIRAGDTGTLRDRIACFDGPALT